MAVSDCSGTLVSAETPVELSDSLSAFLDCLRFSSAIMVVFIHLTQEYFSDEWEDLTWVSGAPVAVFFVLSGFVIRHTLDLRPHGLRPYIVARLARIYSVLVPSLFLTMAADQLGHFLDPDYYSAWSEQSAHLVAKALACLFFVNQAYGHDIVFLTNGPIWSLGYEVPYYFVFGIFCFTSGSVRMLSLLIIGLVIGPNVFVLLPVWLAGVWTCRFVKRAGPSLPRGLMALACMPLIAAGFRHSPDIRAEIMSYAEAVSPLWHGRSEAFILFYVTGGIACLMIVAIHSLENAVSPVLNRAKRSVRFLASGTFSIYLYHFPIMALVYATFHYDKSSDTEKILILVTTIFLCFSLSRITESKKAIWAASIQAGIDWADRIVRQTRPRHTE